MQLSTQMLPKSPRLWIRQRLRSTGRLLLTVAATNQLPVEGCNCHGVYWGALGCIPFLAQAYETQQCARPYASSREISPWKRIPGKSVRTFLGRVGVVISVQDTYKYIYKYTYKCRKYTCTSKYYKYKEISPEFL